MGLFHAVDAFRCIAVIVGIIVTLRIRISMFAGWFFRLKCAWFIVGNLTETGGSNVLQFAMMASMGHHFVGVRAYEITF